MKKPQRNFVIEYKSGRRKADVKTASSIWGSLDLKSVARDVETVLPPQLPGDAHLVASEPARLPDDPAPATQVHDHHAPISKGIDLDRASRDMDLATGDVSAAQDENDAQEIYNNAAQEPRARKPRKVSRGRRALASRPMPKAGNDAPIEPDVELDELDELEEENRVLKTMLVAKLRMENSWLRERLQAGR